MSNETIEFRLQYKDNHDTWCNVYGSYDNYADAMEKLLAEAKADPEYDHRIVRTTLQVLGFITGEGNINEYATEPRRHHRRVGRVC